MNVIERGLFCVTAALLVVVTGPAAAASATPDRSGAGRESITVAMLPVEPTMQAAYAQARGFFAQQGIDAKLTVLSDPAQIPAVILSGDAQFASFSIGGLATLKARGFPVRLVASGALYRRHYSNVAIVALPKKKITRARDLVGKRIAIDAQNTIAHIGLLKWLKRNGVAKDDVTFTELPFAQMLGPLGRGQVDAAVLPEPFVTLALQRGARRVANIFDAVCSKNCLITTWIARKDVDLGLAARFRTAVAVAARWANQKENRRQSGAILAKYAPIDANVLAKMTRTRYLDQLRVSLAQPWIDVYAEFGVIPASFSAIDLVK